MKIVVIGGTGLIGTRVVDRLVAEGIDAVAASRRTGVDSYTGEGLGDVLAGADTIVDLSNSSYTDEAGAGEFFFASTLNLLTYGAAAGVRHHVGLSVVGTDRLARTERGYFAAKAEQERLVTTSAVPYSIVHATQFFEFVESIADAASADGIVRLSQAWLRPMAADDVASAVASTAIGSPTNRIVETAGPEEFRLADFVNRHLRGIRDSREVVTDPLARYFGSELDERELLPSDDAVIFPTRYDDWMRRRGDRAEVTSRVAAR